MKNVVDFLRKVLFSLAFAMFTVLAIFNHQIVNFNLFGFKSFQLPLFFIVFIAFFLGALVGLLYFICSKK